MLRIVTHYSAPALLGLLCLVGSTKGLFLTGEDATGEDDGGLDVDDYVVPAADDANFNANNSRPGTAGSLMGKANVLAPDPIEPPLVPGCYVRMPTGCPRQDGWRMQDFQTWQKDSWPGWKERKFAPGTMKATCEEERKAKLSGWCGANDVESKFVDGVQAGSVTAPPTPTKTGCYVWAPGGCPRQPGFDSRAWRKGWAHDSWTGWQDRSIDPARAVETCNKERQFMLAGWCGSSVVTLWVHQVPTEPVTPGCYVHLPSGCPRQHNMFDARAYQQGWRPDMRGDTQPATDQASCGDDRRHQVNGWCGVVDARVVWVQQPPPDPQHEGCHVWMPSGCPRQARFDATRYQTAWVLDVGKEWIGTTFSEANGKARRMCHSERKQKLQEYCGTTDIKTLYVGAVLKPPEAPGCYLLMPSGCPRQPRFDTSKWKAQWGLDQWHGWLEADHRGEGERRSICEEGRRKAINDWCGTKDAKSVLVAR